MQFEQIRRVHIENDIGCPMTSSDTTPANRQVSDGLPIYNLKAVVKETGLKPDTLRAWERRYGLPEPERTASGHRLYSQYDIDTLKWLTARLDEGLNISRAVALWQELISSGQNPLQLMVESSPQVRPPRPTHSDTVQQSQPPAIAQRIDAVPLSGDQIGRLRQIWIEACKAFDEESAEQALNQAFATLPLETVCIQIMQSGLATIGAEWQAGQMTVQQEHFASALAMRRLHALLNAAPSPTRSGAILITCPPEEEHTFTPLLLALMLRRRGWRVLYLGANVPIRDLEETIARAQPTLVILVAQQLHTAATLLQMSQKLAAQNMPLAFGGRIFVQEPAIKAQIPGYFLGSSVEKVEELVEEIMRSPQPQHAAQHTLPQHAQALHTFQTYSAQIQASTWDKIYATNIEPSAIKAAFEHLYKTIVASLVLGNVSYLVQGARWLRQYLSMHHAMSAEQIDLFVDTYLAAAETHLPPQDKFILQWVQTISQPDATPA